MYCPGRTIAEVIECTQASIAAAGLPAVKPTGRAGLLYELQAIAAGLPTDPELARRIAEPGPLQYRGQTLIPAIVEAVGIAASPLSGPLAVFNAATSSGVLGDQPGVTGVAKLAGAAYGGDMIDPWAEFWVDPYAPGEFASLESPYAMSAADPFLAGDAWMTAQPIQGQLTDYSAMSAAIGPGEVSGLPGGTLGGFAGLARDIGTAYKTVSGWFGGGDTIAAPGTGLRGSTLFGIPGLGLGGATPLLAQGIGAQTGGIGMIGSLVPALTTAVGRITATRAWALVRRNGLGAVATALGIGAAELASWLMANPPRRRRRRGISARDVRTTKRVVGFVCKVNDQLRHIKSRKVC